MGMCIDTVTHTFKFTWSFISSCFVISLKPLDIEFMKQLHDKVNVIPVIAKADTLTPSEVKTLKKRVRVDVLQ